MTARTKTAAKRSAPTITVKEAKAEIRKIIGELTAVRRRVQAIIDGLPHPSEPKRALMQADYIPQDEAQCIRSELAGVVDHDRAEGEGLGRTIQQLEYALGWSTAKSRNLLFTGDDHDSKAPKALGVKAALEMGSEAGMCQWV